MTRDDQPLASAAGVLPGEPMEPRVSWIGQPRREPALDELLDDPIMTLLWKSDRLDPRSARATVLQLREVVRARRCRPPVSAAA